MKGESFIYISYPSVSYFAYVTLCSLNRWKVANVIGKLPTNTFPWEKHQTLAKRESYIEKKRYANSCNCRDNVSNTHPADTKHSIYVIFMLEGYVNITLDFMLDCLVFEPTCAFCTVGSWPWPWAPGKIHGEKLRFFWKRLYDLWILNIISILGNLLVLSSLNYRPVFIYRKSCVQKLMTGCINNLIMFFTKYIRL